jgi:hypothetical protein
MHVSTDKTLSPVENVTGETTNSYFILTLNTVGNASSLVFNISESSVNATTTTTTTTTTTLNMTEPFTEKSLCPPIPPNLSKYYDILHFILLYFAGCWCIFRPVMRTYECILLPLPKLSATYVIFSFLKVFSSTYMWQEERKLYLKFFQVKNKPLQRDIQTSKQNVKVRQNKSYIFC